MTTYNWYTSFFLLAKRCRNDFLPWLNCQLVRCANHIKRNTEVETTTVQCSTLLKFVCTRERELIFQYVVLWKNSAEVEVLLWWEAMHSIPSRTEGFYGSSRAQSERPLCLIPCFAWGCGCFASARSEIPVLPSSWLDHPAPSECGGPFSRSRNATWLWCCAWTADQTHQEEKKS